MKHSPNTQFEIFQLMKGFIQHFSFNLGRNTLLLEAGDLTPLKQAPRYWNKGVLHWRDHDSILGGPYYSNKALPIPIP